MHERVDACGKSACWLPAVRWSPLLARSVTIIAALLIAFMGFLDFVRGNFTDSLNVRAMVRLEKLDKSEKEQTRGSSDDTQ